MSASAAVPFEFRFRVRYGECDAQSVVFNARYADYVDISVNEYIRTLFGDYQALLDQDLDIQVVSMTLNWQSPAHFDDVLCARIEPGKLGNTSFTVHLAFHTFGEERAVANAEITYVLIKPSAAAKTPVPDSIRQKLITGAPGVMISHAGEQA